MFSRFPYPTLDFDSVLGLNSQPNGSGRVNPPHGGGLDGPLTALGEGNNGLNEGISSLRFIDEDEGSPTE